MTIESRLADLAPRRRPTQERSRRRVAGILAATSALLAEVGAAELTTAMIAERAGVPIGSLYQYFPNKRSLLSALAAAVMERVNAASQEILAGPRIDDSWGTLVDRVIDAQLSALRREPGAAALLMAIRAMPELYEITQRARARTVESVVMRLLREDDSLPGTDAAVVARVVVDVTAALTDRVLVTRDPRLARRYVTELKRLVQGYLATHFGPPRSASGSWQWTPESPEAAPES